MMRALAACLVACLVLGTASVRADAKGGGAPKAAPAHTPKTGPRIAWFHRMSDARKIATETGRPLFVAIHVRGSVASPAATARIERWSALYDEPSIVELSRRCACVLRVIQAPEGADPDKDGKPAAFHLVVDGSSRVLARLDVSAPEAGEAGRRQLGRILRGGLKNFGAIATDAPLITQAMVARTKLKLDGISPSKPVAVPLGVPGVRLRLRWELPAPTLQGAEADRIRATVRMRWDDRGPFDIGQVEFGAGEEIDQPIDVRFDEIEGLAELATQGTHRVDLYLVALPGSYPFSKGPLHVGRVWIELGDGGGGGGASTESESEPKPDETPPPPPPKPDEGKEELPPPPPPEREEVVDPFVNEGDAVQKDDAVVAVEDPDGGVKPPQQVPLELALREFEKLKEREVSRAGFSSRDRDLLRRYFEALARTVGAKPPPKDSGKHGGKGGGK